MTQQYYFVCSIGPVQDFIATARTSQDLWFGSWMLSELAKAAAKALKDGGQHRLIFPAPNADVEPGSNVDVTNKVVALITGDPQTIGELVKKAVEKRLGALTKLSFDAVDGKFDRDLAERQVQDLTEFYWAAAPYEKGKYADTRKRAEALLNARKNTRNFGKADGKSGLPKSSLDGFRESVLPQKEPKDGFLFKQYKAEKGESLSGVDLLKRRGERVRGGDFESTTDLASKSFVLHLNHEIGITKRTEFQKRIEDLLSEYTKQTETPGTLFYVDRLVQLIDDAENFPQFRHQYSELWQEYKVDCQPLPYYALLQADGDNMGKTIDAQTEKEKHSDLSQALSNFNKEAKDIIKKHKGIPVYVGGDDVLAYLPVHTALECIVELNACFDKWVRTKFDFIDDEQKKHPSLSVGLAIAHHLTPLSDVLEQARKAEKAAKKVDGKNGLVISMSKRSGSERSVTGKLPDLTERLKTLIELTRQKAISHGAAYELEELQRRMKDSGLPAEALEKEALRILKRKRESGGEKNVDEKNVIEVIANWLPQFKDEKGILKLDELAGEMVIAAELAKAYEMADPKEKKV